MKQHIIIGTRGSKLALIQCEIIINKLLEYSPNSTFETKIISTTGDKNMKPIPLDTVGKDWFTKELDNALLKNEIDMAVHSLKDLSVDMPKGLIIAAIAKREDARDVFVSKNNITFQNIKKGAIIGTDSIRRKIQILQIRPDLIIKSIRGNVLTRLEKLDKGDFDGLILAAAGLIRLGIKSRITNFFDVSEVIPSPGQGALAIVIKENNISVSTLLKKLHHVSTYIEVTAERAFSQKLGGGCKTPIGAYAKINKSNLVIHGFRSSLDGNNISKKSLVGNISFPEKLGISLADKFLKNTINIFQKPKFIIITRPDNITTSVQKQIEALGLIPYFYPSIAIARSMLTKREENYFKALNSYDWFIFTSQNGVRLFMEILNQLKIPLTILKNKKIAVVGKKTAEAVRSYNLEVTFIPTSYTTESLADELTDVKGKKIFMARANLATPNLTEKLQNRGATVLNVPIYKTSYIENSNPEFIMLVNNHNIYCLTFTSPSTVTGFIKNIKNDKLKKEIKKIPVLSIGPVTTNVLTKYGFNKIYTADTFTFEGMLRKLNEMVL